MADGVVYLPDPKSGETACTTCIFSLMAISDDEDEGPLLKCHRYPPQLYIDEEGVACQSFPDANEWCGEFRPKE